MTSYNRHANVIAECSAQKKNNLTEVLAMEMIWKLDDEDADVDDDLDKDADNDDDDFGDDE